MTITTHDHSRGYPMRSFTGRPGVFVQRFGRWDRPLRVWRYRGAWRVICLPCMTPIQSGDDLYGGGWPTQAAAFDAAITHCRCCPVAVREAA